MDKGSTLLRLIGGTLSLQNIRGIPTGSNLGISAPGLSPKITGPDPEHFEWTSEGTEVFLGRGINDGSAGA